MSDDVLEAAKTQQRSIATGISVYIRLSLLEDMIAEIERLRARANREFKPVSEADQVASMADIRMKHTGINHP